MHPSIQRSLFIALSMILLSLSLAGCGKSQAEKDAEARAKYQKMNQEYQRRMKETNDRLLGGTRAKDSHANQ